MKKQGDKYAMEPTKNSWVCKNEKIILTSPVMEIVQRQCQSSEDERQYTFYLLRSRDWCNIIPITEDGKVVMVKQYRVGVSKHTLEVPGGIIDPNDTDSKAAAIREMEEETGYAPVEGSKCVSVGWTFPNPAIQNNLCHSYVIGPVRKVTNQNLDLGEMIEIVEVGIDDIPNYIIKGEITHALMLNAFFFLLLQSSEGSQNLVNQLKTFTRA